MARTNPAVQGNILVWRDGDQERSITIETPAWYGWLAEANTFSFASAAGRFTARKEHFQRGGWYWKAYRSRSGKLHQTYLGKSEVLTLERLTQAATRLAGPRANEERSSGDDGDRSTALPNPAPNDLAPAELQTFGPSVDGPIDFLLTTKLSLPPARPDFVARPRLVAQIEAGLRGKLTIISAPAGSGKTILLSQWSQQTDFPVSWVSLEAGDNDPARFWAYVITALQTRRPHVGDVALASLRSGRGTRVELFLTSLLNDLAAMPGNLVLVLDDYHLVETDAIHSAMTFLLDHLPPQLHLVVATRTDPPLSLTRLRGRGQLTELRVADMSFTLDETGAFLNQVMSLGLSAEDVAALVQRSEGWIVGLQLAALSLRGCEDIHGFVKAFSGDHRYVLGYLAEEVFRRQPEEVQSFLLQTSILDRLISPLCEAVTGQGNGQAMLEMLERSNLFTVSLDNEQRWYRYHHLFADFLRSTLQRAKTGQGPELHRRASAWYGNNGLVGEAIGHALAAGDFAVAAGLIEDATETVLKRGEILTIMDWIRVLPDDQVRARPRLLLNEAWALAHFWEFGAAEARLQEVEQSVDKATAEGGQATVPNSETGFARFQPILDEVTALRAVIACFRSDGPLAISLALKALEHWPEEEAFVRTQLVWVLGSAYMLSGDMVKANERLAEARVISQTAHLVGIAVIALTQQADLYAFRGQLNQAAEIYRQAAQMADDLGDQPSPVKCAPYVGLGRVLLEWNNLEGATRYVVDGLELGRKEGNMFVVLNAYNAMARLKQAQGNTNAALGLLQKAEHLAQVHNLPQQAAGLATYRARLNLIQGNIEAAAQWAREAEASLNAGPNRRQMVQIMTWARVAAAQGRPSEAIETLTRLMKVSEAAGRGGGMVKVMALLALLLQLHGETERALIILKRCLSSAKPERYARTFIDEGAPMAALLTRFLQGRTREQETRHNEMSRYVQSLLAAFELSPSPAYSRWGSEKTVPMALDPLTERELQVLRLIVAGLPDREIAQQLVVSLNTAKTHIKNIYFKLDVHSRQEAAVKAEAFRVHPNRTP